MNRTREKLKTVLICLLLVGMVYLTYSVWFFDSPLGEMKIEDLFNVSDTQKTSNAAGEDLSHYGIRPLSIAVRENGECRAILYDGAALEGAYKKLRDGIASAFERGREIKTVSDKEWRDALSKDGVFLDYSGNIPIEALKLWLGEENGEDTTCGQYFLFSTSARTVKVYIKNTETQRVYLMETSSTSETLKKALSEIAATPAEFALLSETDFSAVNPEMLIPEELIKPAAVSSYNIYTAFEADTVAACLECFKLRNTASSSYTEKDGTQVYITDMVSMKISPTGIVSYTDLRDEADEALGIKINSDEEELTFAERCEAARGVVASLAKKVSGSGQIYILHAGGDANSAEIIFGCHINGIPVNMKETPYFARVTVKKNSIGEVRMNLSGYEVSAQTMEMLPARLAAAAVSQTGTVNTLSLRYGHTDDGKIAPLWFVNGTEKGEG